MESSQGQSCPLCGQVEELQAMVAVHVPFARVPTHDTVIICRPCASAVAGRALELEGEAPADIKPEGAKHEGKRSMPAKSGKSAQRDIAAPDTRDPSAA